MRKEQDSESVWQIGRSQGGEEEDCGSEVDALRRIKNSTQQRDPVQDVIIITIITQYIFVYNLSINLHRAHRSLAVPWSEVQKDERLSINCYYRPDDKSVDSKYIAE